MEAECAPGSGGDPDPAPCSALPSARGATCEDDDWAPLPAVDVTTGAICAGSLEVRPTCEPAAGGRLTCVLGAFAGALPVAAEAPPTACSTPCPTGGAGAGTVGGCDGLAGGGVGAADTGGSGEGTVGVGTDTVGVTGTGAGKGTETSSAPAGVARISAVVRATAETAAVRELLSFVIRDFPPASPYAN